MKSQRGFDPSGVPMADADAVRGFLDALGVLPDRIPLQPEAQARLYRSLLADRSMLIVPDNAREGDRKRTYLADDTVFPRRVALALIKPAAARDDPGGRGARPRLLRERAPTRMS